MKSFHYRDHPRSIARRLEHARTLFKNSRVARDRSVLSNSRRTDGIARRIRTSKRTPVPRAQEANCRLRGVAKIGNASARSSGCLCRPEFRGQGLVGLAEAMIREAKHSVTRGALGHLPPKINDAIVLYRSLGFQEIEPTHQSVAGASLWSWN